MCSSDLKLGFDTIQERERQIGEYCYKALTAIPYVHLLGAQNAEAHHGIFTFTLEGVHPHDIAEILSADGVCIRAGHHCAQPLLRAFGLDGAVRLSPAFYNTTEEIIRTMDALDRCIRVFGKAAKR